VVTTLQVHRESVREIFNSIASCILTCSERQELSDFAANIAGEKYVPYQDDFGEIVDELTFLQIAGKRWFRLSLLGCLQEEWRNLEDQPDVKISVETLLSLSKNKIPERDIENLIGVDLIIKEENGTLRLSDKAKAIFSSNLFARLAEYWEGKPCPNSFPTMLANWLNERGVEPQQPLSSYTFTPREYEAVRIPSVKEFRATEHLFPNWDELELSEKIEFASNLRFSNLYDCLDKNFERLDRNFSCLKQILELSHLEFESLYGFQYIPGNSLYIPAKRGDLATIAHLLARGEKEVLEELFAKFPHFLDALRTGYLFNKSDNIQVFRPIRTERAMKKAYHRLFFDVISDN